MKIEVVYGRRERQGRFVVEVEEGTTVLRAIERSGVLAEFPEIDLGRNRVAVYSKLVALDSRLGDGDRVEILRPLTVEPSAPRRRRARD